MAARKFMSTSSGLRAAHYETNAAILKFNLAFPFHSQTKRTADNSLLALSKLK